MEKLIKNNFPQNLAICLYLSSPVFTYTDSRTATRNDRPMVSGTNKGSRGRLRARTRASARTARPPTAFAR